MNDHQSVPPVIPLKRAHDDEDGISCICGFSYDDGFSIACDDCSRWCHAACFDIVDGHVPEEWRCWLCVPRPVDKDKAVKLQRARLRQGQGNDRKQRRASTTTVPDDSHSNSSWSLSYVHIPHDIVPHHDTREKLRRQAQHWRGVTALDDGPRTTVKPLPPSSFSNPALSLYTNPSVLPPAYAVHTSSPIPEDHLITPYTSTITPSSSYLSDPLNSYAHLGMPKPFVHLIGPPLDIALDSRIAGNSARFVRNGCRPNAVLRPFLCPRSQQDTLSFGVFALRDLKANEEVVLGWEWDDGHVVHHLPALIETPEMFPVLSPDDTVSPEKLDHIRNQLSNILHALSSTFTTCACGARAKNCAITQMAAFVDGDVNMIHHPEKVDLGPLVGKRRGFRTKERVPYSGGLSGMEMYDAEHEEPQQHPVVIVSPASPAPEIPPAKIIRIQCPATPNDRPPDPPEQEPELPMLPCEDRMPPKMRKKWIHRELEALRESSARCLDSPPVGLGIRVEMDVDDSISMPPPPVPSDRTPDPSTTTSPSSSFARLSLISPTIPGMPPSAPMPLSTSWSPLTRTPQTVVDEADTFLVPTPRSPSPPPMEEGMEEDSLTVPEQAPLPSPQSPPPSPPESPPPASPPSPAEEIILDDEPPISSPEVVVITEPSLPPPPPPPPSPPPPPPVEELEMENSIPGLDGTHGIFATMNEVPTATEPVSEPAPASSPTTSVSSLEPSTLTARAKMKISLKDFAMRKRKQREEERSKVEEERERVRGAKEEGEEEEWEEEHQKRLKMERDREEEHSKRFFPIPPAIETRQAKQEVIEATIGIMSGEESAGGLSYEDGEISSAGGTPPLPPQSTSQSSIKSRSMSTGTTTNLFRSHTPPTQPRLFNASPSPSNAPVPFISASVSAGSATTLTRRPPPTFRLPTSLPAASTLTSTTSPGAGASSSTSTFTATNTPTTLPLSRPLPSGPRALRAVNSQPMNSMSMNMSGMGIMGTTPATSVASGSSSTTYNQPPPPPYRSFSGPGYIPRGPSADRDRERERERDRMDWERDRERERERERGWQQRSRVRGPPGWGR